ncbi:MAG: TrkA family potassium uptake protein [Armatimonadota bacterium]
MLRAYLLDLWLFVRRVWLNILGILLVLLASALFFHAMQIWPGASVLNCFVNAFYMMTVEAVDVPDLWYVEVFVFVLPLMGMLLAAEGVISATVLFLSKSRREGEWNAIMAATRTGHVVICGLGQLGDALCDGLRRAGWSVVVVEINAENPSVTTARRRDVPVIIGDMTTPDALHEANVARARCVILCGGDDLANLEAAIAVKELNPCASVYARVYKRSLADRISAAMQQDIRTFSPYATAAERLVGEITQHGSLPAPEQSSEAL